MSKEQFIAAHEREVADYLDRNPNASWSDAYLKTTERAFVRMVEDEAGRADMIRQRAKDERDA